MSLQIVCRIYILTIIVLDQNSQIILPKFSKMAKVAMM